MVARIRDIRQPLVWIAQASHIGRLLLHHFVDFVDSHLDSVDIDCSTHLAEDESMIFWCYWNIALSTQLIYTNWPLREIIKLNLKKWITRCFACTIYTDFVSPAQFRFHWSVSDWSALLGFQNANAQFPSLKKHLYRQKWRNRKKHSRKHYSVSVKQLLKYLERE